MVPVTHVQDRGGLGVRRLQHQQIQRTLQLRTPDFQVEVFASLGTPSQHPAVRVADGVHGFQVGHEIPRRWYSRAADACVLGSVFTCRCGESSPSLRVFSFGLHPLRRDRAVAAVQRGHAPHRVSVWYRVVVVRDGLRFGLHSDDRAVAALRDLGDAEPVRRG